ncbi:MAG: DUF6776 family protein [Steroidobacteraceae bacterium]
MLAAVAVAGSFWLGHRQGQRVAGYDFADEVRTRRTLEARLEVLEKRNAKLNAQVAELEMARRIDRDAYGQVERTLGELQSKLARQGDDLAFYRSIVSPEDGVQGLRIQRFAVRPGTGPREFVVEVTLIQALRQDGLVSGSVQVTLQGMVGTRPARYTLAQLGGSGRTTYSFRYFQTIERTVELPEGFQPFDVEVRAQPGRGDAVRRSFPWKVRDSAAPEPEAITEAPGGVR